MRSCGPPERREVGGSTLSLTTFFVLACECSDQAKWFSASLGAGC
jgi:hypothetical protein